MKITKKQIRLIIREEIKKLQTDGMSKDDMEAVALVTPNGKTVYVHMDNVKKYLAKGYKKTKEGAAAEKKEKDELDVYYAELDAIIAKKAEKKEKERLIRQKKYQAKKQKK